MSMLDLAAWADETVNAEVVITLTEWSTLTAQQRSALAVARKAWRARRDVQAALAMAGPLERAQVLAEDDGGAALLDAHLSAWHAQTRGAE